MNGFNLNISYENNDRVANALRSCISVKEDKWWREGPIPNDRLYDFELRQRWKMGIYQ